MPLPRHAIAIDGPAASGKSSVAQRLAARLGYLYVNTGNMYRAVALLAHRRGVDPADGEAVGALLKEGALSFASAGGEGTIRIDGSDPGDALKSAEVNASVSAIASHAQIRQTLVARQRDYLKEADVVMEGRDIGSVVFAQTPYKFFIDAAPEVRAARRAGEGLHDNLAARDATDSQRKASPMVVPEGAVTIDSSHLSIDAVVEAVLSALKERGITPAGR
ncbi:MAG TPA: (d)CMP kinase [Chthoniobacteraceae bacterium]|nr:(d)CMP kinase [Chthoniobacteraceae bacterium]